MKKFLFLFLFMLVSAQAEAAYSRNTAATFFWETTTTAVNWDNYATGYSIDDDKSVVPIGFPFTFGGVTYTSVRIISNGLLHFGADQSMHQAYYNDTIPVTGSWWYPDYDRYIAPYWDDLDPSSGGIVTYDTLGTAGVDLRFVVTWDGLVKYGPTGNYNIQVILYEDGRFKFQYNSADANGSSATIGYEVSNSDFDQYSWNSNSVSIGQAIEYTPIPVVYTKLVVDDNYSGTPASACEQPAGATYYSTITDAVNAVKGGGFANPKIRVCPGNYTIGTTKLDKANFNNMIVEGTSGNAADVIITNTGDGFYIRSGSSGVQFYNMTITGGAIGIYGRSTTGLHLENMAISATSSYGIYLRNSDSSYLKGVTVNNTGSYGIYVRGSNAASINDTVISNTALSGIYGDNNADDMVLNKVSVSSSTEYCVYSRGQRAIMYELTLSQCTLHALYIRGRYSEVDTADISNISVPATNHYGVYANAADLLLSNITVDTGSDGVFFSGAADRTEARNLVLSNQGVDGVHIASGGNDIMLDGVTVSSPGDDGVEIVGGNRTILKNLLLNSIPVATGNYGIASDSQVEISNASISGGNIGVYLNAADNSVLSGVSVSGAQTQGLKMQATSNSTVTFGSFSNNDTGVLLINSSQNNTFEFNEVKDNVTNGILLSASGTNSGNTFDENCLAASNPSTNIVNNSGGTNNFFDAATSTGNFYASSPSGSGYSETCLDTNSDGVCDAPYTIPGASGGTDNFPSTTCHIQVSSTEYRFDENSWNGTTGEVKDSGNNAHHGTALNGATTYSAQSLGGGVCRIGYFNNLNSSSGEAVNVPYHADLNPSASGYTAMMWVRLNRATQPAGDSVLLSNRNSLNSGNGFTLAYNAGSRKLNWYVGSTAVVQSASRISDNTWTHIAVTYRPGSDIAIYINGVLDNSSTASIPAASQTQTTNPLFVADNGASLPYRGYIDELRTYQKALSPPQIQYYMNLSRSCAVGTLDHFDISPFSNTGSTCLPTAVTFTAYDSNNNVLTGYTGTVDISTSSANGIWDTVQNTTPGYNPAGTDNGSYSLAFSTSDSGQKTLYLYNQHAQNLTISAVDNSIPASLSTSGNYSFADNAFVWDESIMSFSNPVAGYNHQFQVRVYRRDTTLTPSNCAIANNYNGSKSLKAYYTADVNHPAGAAAPALDNGSATVSLPASIPSADNFTLGFTNGVSDVFNLVTSDVGKYSLTLVDSSSANAVSGSSSVLTVRPFGLAYVDSAGNAYNPTTLPSQTSFIAAGAAFNSQIKAVQYVSGDAIDTASGNPLDYTQLANNPPTASFDATVSLSASAVNPTVAQGGVLGSFTPTSASGFSGGVATVSNASYSEVGTIQLDLTSSNYLGTSGLTVSGQQQLGRFRADHFTIENIVPGTFADSCNNQFSYLGQTLAYTSNPSFSIVARNAANVITSNFDDFSANGGNNFALNLDASDISGNYSDAAMPATISMNNSGILASLTAPVGDGSNNGSFSAQIIRPVHYVKPATASYGAGGYAPFVASPVVSVSVNEAVDGISSAASNVTAASSGAGNIYHGRLNLSSAGGSRYSNLSAPFTLEYFNGTGWAKNTQESATCTALVAGDFSYAGVNSFSLTPIVSGTGSIDFSCSLASPCTAEKQLLSSSLGSNFPHLLYDWDRNGTPNDDTAYISFGVFAGRKSHVYIRENQ